MFNLLVTVQKLGYPMERKGQHWVISCPFRSEKTPSLTLYETETFFCFGCRKHGTAVDLVQVRFGYTIAQALQWLESNVKFKLQEKLPDIKITRPKNSTVDLRAIEYWNILLNHTGQNEWFLKRGFTLETIAAQQFGWNGTRFTIPVWDDKTCVGVRLRRWDEIDHTSAKYLGLTGDKATVWGKHHCRGHSVIYAFAGELDAALAVQDGLPAFSMVNGQYAFKSFPDDWLNLWFPDAQKIIIVYDIHEELSAAKLKKTCIQSKKEAEIILWPPSFNVKDYSDFRMQFRFIDFQQLVREQL